MQIEQLLQEKGFNEFKPVDVDAIPIEAEVRKLCEQNACGNYGKNYMCPPAVDSIEKWKKEILSFKQAVLVSKVYPTNGSFDLKGMYNGAIDFEKALRGVKEACEEKRFFDNIMVLGAGPCMFCKKCAFVDDKPCRFPDKPYPSVEACGVDVVRLSRSVGIKYHNGKNTVTYFGMILFN